MNLFESNPTTVQSQYFVFLIPRQRGENTNEALNTKRHTLTTEKISSQCIRQDNTVQLHEIVPNIRMPFIWQALLRVRTAKGNHPFIPQSQHCSPINNSMIPNQRIFQSTNFPISNHFSVVSSLTVTIRSSTQETTSSAISMASLYSSSVIGSMGPGYLASTA